MRRSIVVFVLLVGFQVQGQGLKDSLIEVMQLDTVVQYEGKGQLQNDNCLLLKYSGNVTDLISQIVLMHVQNPDVVQRTDKSLYIPQTTKPYWVYGRYDVNVKWTKKENYFLVEIWFYAYNRPGNYRMYGAASSYQKIVNELLD